MQRFVFFENTSAKVFKGLDEKTLCRLFRGFCFEKGSLQVDKCEGDFLIVIGSPKPAKLAEGDEYAISVSPSGVCIRGRDKSSLMRGFIALIERIEAEDLTEKLEFFITCGEIRGNFSVSVRLANLCVFP